MIPTIITQALNGSEIRLGNLEPTRDLNYVSDTVEGFIKAAETPKAIGETINLGSGREISIGDLVRRCRLVMAGEPLPHPDPIDPRHLSLAADAGVHVELTPADSPHIYNVTMIAPDRRGLLSKAAAVLALNSLRVHSASVNAHQGSAINTFVVSPHFGSPPAAELLRQQFILALDGELARAGGGGPGPPRADRTTASRRSRRWQLQRMPSILH